MNHPPPAAGVTQRSGQPACPPAATTDFPSSRGQGVGASAPVEAGGLESSHPPPTPPPTGRAPRGAVWAATSQMLKVERPPGEDWNFKSPPKPEKARPLRDPSTAAPRPNSRRPVPRKTSFRKEGRQRPHVLLEPGSEGSPGKPRRRGAGQGWAPGPCTLHHSGPAV